MPLLSSTVFLTLGGPTAMVNHGISGLETITTQAVVTTLANADWTEIVKTKASHAIATVIWPSSYQMLVWNKLFPLYLYVSWVMITHLTYVGTLTDKDLLPVTTLNFGRTIAPTSTNRHTLGRLECSGKVVLNGMPSSCQDLWRIGYTLSGLYSIKGSSSNKIETVYCDFSKLPGDQGAVTSSIPDLGSN